MFRVFWKLLNQVAAFRDAVPTDWRAELEARGGSELCLPCIQSSGPERDINIAICIPLTTKTIYLVGYSNFRYIEL